ncbi:AtpZ/AtpI family protein [Pseudothermotoga thermarum]|uniref:ATP synthase protein I n=1 Tax=Pseudothermotoga thermarum DSM 5069 TaxID=688269 RepID=F7YV76_9THEM|nr:AtpZ/AtpI family protein [Pseudothermotoga thermarum]AEH50375.1 hypothetical protein Theth_0276 [Pseudothermotoga thermarum DSM 5069]
MSRFAIFFQFGVTVVSNILVGTVLGYYIDKWTFNNKVLFVVFIFLGIASGLYNGFKFLLKEAEKYDKRDKKDDKSDNPFRTD